MRECPAVARAEIERLQAKGISLTLDDLAWLMSLGRRVEHPDRYVSPLLAAVPVVAGSEPFYPLTNQAAWWLAIAAPWFGGNGLCHVLGYAHRHARLPGHFEALCTPKAAAEAVLSWRRGLTITDVEIMAACERVADNDAPARPDHGGPDPHCEMLARAVAMTGLPRDYWATATPQELSDVVCEGIKLAGIGAGADLQVEAHASAEALRDLLLACQLIEARHSGQ